MEVVHGVSLRVRKSEVAAVLGSNGVGKSTLIGALTGLVGLMGGEVYLEGNRIGRSDAHVIRMLGVSCVPEGRRIFANLTVEENLIIGGHIIPSRNERQNALARAFDSFPILYERRRLSATALSGGEQQMLAIARALMADPKVLLLDEPTLGLAPKIVSQVCDTVRQLADDGIAVLVAEQNARSILRVSDTAYVMADGDLVLESKANAVDAEAIERAYMGVVT